MTRHMQSGANEGALSVTWPLDRSMYAMSSTKGHVIGNNSVASSLNHSVRVIIAGMSHDFSLCRNEIARDTRPLCLFVPWKNAFDVIHPRPDSNLPLTSRIRCDLRYFPGLWRPEIGSPEELYMAHLLPYTYVSGWIPGSIPVI